MSGSSQSLPDPSDFAPIDLLPHGPSMVFIDEVLEYGAESVVCRVVPGSNDGQYARDGVVPATMCVEYMAQAISAYAGLRAEPGERRQIGYIIAVRSLRVHVPGFVVGQPLIVRANRQWGEAHLGRFEAAIEREGEVVAQAFMSVYRPTAEELQ